MEDVADGLTSAWKGAVRGVKSGYKMTKTALKNLPMEKWHVSGSGGVMSHADVRRLFRLKYGAAEAKPTDGAERATATEGSEAESSDDEPLTDEQVHERVDKKFFDKSYDPMRYELTHMEVTYTDGEDEGRAEREATEAKILDLRQKCTVVSTTLKKRVLAHHQAFVNGVEEIRVMNDSLLQTSSDCKKGRNAVRRAKSTVVSQVALLAKHRTRQNIQATISLIDAMDRMCWKRNQLHALISNGKLVEAKSLLQKEGTIEMEERLRGVYCLRNVMDEWRVYRDTPAKLNECLEMVLRDCLTVKFIPATYRNALESAPALGGGAQTCTLIAQLLWQSAVQILTKSLVEVSYVKSDTAPIADIAEAIHPDHLTLCLCQMAARLMDFFFLYLTILRLHESEQRSGSPYAELHGQALKSIRDIGHRIGRDLVEKIAQVLSSARLDAVDVDRVLHMFVIVGMLVEAISAIGMDKTELASARTQMKTVLLQYMRRNYQSPKAKEVLAFMSDDAWNVCDISASAMNVVRPLSPAGYRSTIKVVKRYLAESNSFGESDGVGIGATNADNPFYSAKMMVPQDLSALLQTESYGQYWAELKSGEDSGTARDGGGGSGPDEASLTDEVAFNSLHAGGGGGNKIPGSSPTAAKPTTAPSAVAPSMASTAPLAAEAALPPSVLTTSAMTVTNAILEFEARVAVRYPPLAADLLGWCEELISVYVYSVLDSFVSISRTVSIEHQGDLSRATQQVIGELRAAAERAVGVANGQFVPLSASRQIALGLDPAVVAAGAGAGPGGSAGASSGGGSAAGGGPGAAAAANAQVRFPPRVTRRVAEEMTSGAYQYGLGHRAVACDSCTTLVFFYEAAVRAVGPLLPSTVVQQSLDRCRVLYKAFTEVLHVCMHRLCQAIFPMEAICTEIAKLKMSKEEVKVSPYVSDLVASMKALQQRRMSMPTPVLEKLFLQRFIFAVQATLLREYSKLSKKKMSDLFVMQLQVDVQAFQREAATAFGRENVVLPDHVLGLIKTGFYMDDKEQRLEWVRRFHRNYYAADLVNWMSAGDRPFKIQVEDLLAKELHHEDALPVDNFVQQL